MGESSIKKGSVSHGNVTRGCLKFTAQSVMTKGNKAFLQFRVRTVRFSEVLRNNRSEFGRIVARIWGGYFGAFSVLYSFCDIYLYRV